MINLFVKFAYLAFFKRLRKPTGPRPSYVEWFNTILSDKKQQIPHHSEFIEFAGNHLLRLVTSSETIVGVQEEETYDFFKWLLLGIDQRTFIKEQKKCPDDLSSSSKKEEEIKGLIVDDGENYSLDDLLKTIVHPNGEKINFWLLLIYLYFVI
jgi:hypothetical protein